MTMYSKAFENLKKKTWRSLNIDKASKFTWCLSKFSFLCPSFEEKEEKKAKQQELDDIDKDLEIIFGGENKDE